MLNMWSVQWPPLLFTTFIQYWITERFDFFGVHKEWQNNNFRFWSGYFPILLRCRQSQYHWYYSILRLALLKNSSLQNTPLLLYEPLIYFKWIYHVPEYFGPLFIPKLFRCKKTYPVHVFIFFKENLTTFIWLIMVC